jgi:hypothetical protein
MPRLTDDATRCLDAECTERESCLRRIERDVFDRWAPSAQSLYPRNESVNASAVTFGGRCPSRIHPIKVPWSQA